MNKKRVSLFLGLLFSSLFIVSCGSEKEGEGSNPDANIDFTGTLTNISESLIIPSYENLVDATSKLETAAKTYQLDSSDANFTSLQEAYLNAHTAWGSSAMYEFGPAANVVLKTTFNTYPTDTAHIKDNASSLGPYNLEFASNIDAIGLNGLDYLLYGIGAPLSSSQQAYVVALCEQLNEKASSVLSTWKSSYKADFIANTGTSNGSSVSLLLNAMSLHAERFIRTAKVRIPAGILTGNVVTTQLVEAPYSATFSHQYIQQSLEALSNFYYGNGTAGDGLGFDDYLQVLDADYQETKLHLQVREQLTEAINKSKEITDLQESLTNNRSLVVELYNEIQDVVILIKVDMTSAMSVAITYEDTDGD